MVDLALMCCSATVIYKIRTLKQCGRLNDCTWPAVTHGCSDPHRTTPASLVLESNMSEQTVQCRVHSQRHLGTGATDGFLLVSRRGGWRTRRRRKRRRRRGCNWDHAWLLVRARACVWAYLIVQCALKCAINWPKDGLEVFAALLTARPAPALLEMHPGINHWWFYCGARQHTRVSSQICGCIASQLCIGLSILYHIVIIDLN